jgi:hypothetical protein
MAGWQNAYYRSRHDSAERVHPHLPILFR